jgi:hypothetical protein
VRHWSRQALRLAQEVSVRQDRTHQCGVVVGEKSIQRCAGSQAAIDGGGLEAALGLLDDEVVYVVESDRLRWSIPDDFDELGKVVTVISAKLSS